MQTIRTALNIAAAVVILVSAFELVRPVSVNGDPIKDTRIVNTPAEPIPAAIQGTVAVSGAVSGTVDARQSGSWGVDILNAPTVGIDPLRNTVQLLSQGTQTGVLLNQSFNNSPTGGLFLDLIDVRPYSKVRFSGTINGSGDINFELLTDPDTSFPHNGLLLDSFTSGSTFTKVYDVPGAYLLIKITPSDSNNQAILTLYGH